MLWDGAVAQSGYGTLGQKYAHRIAYEEAYGSIPDGLHIDHICRNRLCVNPEHLEAVTQAENNRRNKRPLCRKSLHLMVPENVTPEGRCRTCKNARQRAAYARRKAARG